MSVAALALPSCRIINGKPDFNWITDQFTPAVDDSVIVDRGIGALDIPATETLPVTAAMTPLPPPQSAAEAASQPPLSPAENAPKQPLVYTVVAGDTLSGIAAKHRTRTKDLITLNKLDVNKPLQLNQKLLIPAVDGGVQSAPTTPTDTVTKSEQTGYFRRLFGQMAGETQPEQHKQHITYTVVAGDTLSAIARRHGVRTQTLIEFNKLDINKPLQINQKLLIPTQGSGTPKKQRINTPPQQNIATASAAPETQQDSQIPTPPPTAAPEQSDAPTDAPDISPAPSATYTIQDGDTLFGIARKLNISPARLMQANNIAPDAADKLQAGATLIIPSTPEQP